MRQNHAALLALVSALLGTSGCATILGGGTAQSVSLRAEPQSVQYAIKSASGLQMSAGQTPQQVRLPRKNEYEIEFTAPGYQTQRMALTKGLNGWVWGNLFVGWVIGFGVDFIGGAAWKLEPALVDIRMARSGDGTMSAVVRLLDDDGKLIREVTLPMLPAER